MEYYVHCVHQKSWKWWPPSYKKLCGNSLPWVDKFKHLGHTLTNDPEIPYLELIQQALRQSLDHLQSLCAHYFTIAAYDSQVCDWANNRQPALVITLMSIFLGFMKKVKYSSNVIPRLLLDHIQHDVHSTTSFNLRKIMIESRKDDICKLSKMICLKLNLSNLPRMTFGNETFWQK